MTQRKKTGPETRGQSQQPIFSSKPPAIQQLTNKLGYVITTILLKHAWHENSDCKKCVHPGGLLMVTAVFLNNKKN